MISSEKTHYTGDRNNYTNEPSFLPEINNSEEKASNPFSHFIDVYTPELTDKMIEDIKKMSPAKQLSEILFLYNVMEYHLETAPSIESFDNKMLYNIRKVINSVPEDKATPLIKYARELGSDNEILELKACHALRILGDDGWDRWGRLTIKKKWTDRVNKSQAGLHNDFPLAPEDRVLVSIAPEVVASLDKNYHFDAFYDAEGDSISLAEQGQAQKKFHGADLEALKLLGDMHHYRMEWITSHKMNLNLSDVSLPAQIQLLYYMTKADGDRFDKLCKVLYGLGKSSNSAKSMSDDELLRLKLAENFLAADFGEDFGDALLDIASSETLDDKQIGEILDTVTSARESISKITGLYNGFEDGDFAKEYTRAANERLTDALTVFRKIAKDGEATADLEWAGKSRLDYESAMEALKYETKSLEIISGTLGDVASGATGAFAEKVLKPDYYRGRTLYNFYSPKHGYVLLYTRPEGSGTFEPMLEYGTKNGVEASISLIANPVNPFELPNPHRPDYKKIKDPRYYDKATMDKVSAIRLDREGRTPGAPANDPNRDPINPIGTVSVDLAAINDRADTPSGKIARLLSVGNKLRESNTDFSLNHNTKWFNQDAYGTATGFRELVEYVDSLAGGWCKSRPPKSNEGFRRYMNAGRGHKATRSVA